MKIENTLTADASWAAQAGIAPSEIKTVGQYAQQQFKQGKYHEALRLFYLLARIDGTQARHWLDLGCAISNLKNTNKLCFASRRHNNAAHMILTQRITRL